MVPNMRSTVKNSWWRYGHCLDIEIDRTWWYVHFKCHIIHRNVKYADTETANIHDDGYAIMALFYVVSHLRTIRLSMSYTLLSLGDGSAQPDVWHDHRTLAQHSRHPPNVHIRHSHLFGESSADQQRSLLPLLGLIHDSQVQRSGHLDRIPRTSLHRPETGIARALTPLSDFDVQIKLFRLLYTTYFDIRTGHLKRLVGNIRHLHDIGDRKVYTSSAIPIDSSHSLISIIALVLYKITSNFINLLQIT